MARAQGDPAHGRGDGPLRHQRQTCVRRDDGDAAVAEQAAGKGPRSGHGVVGQRVVRGAPAASFENWADCDTACFKLFDQTPFAWEKARQWAASPREFVKRGGFALMACLALHDKAAPDERFLAFLPLIEKGARDERNFVKKAVSWALRAIGRRNLALNAAALTVAERLALSEEAACRWVGNDALRELASPKVRSHLARRARVDRATTR